MVYKLYLKKAVYIKEVEKLKSSLNNPVILGKQYQPV